MTEEQIKQKAEKYCNFYYPNTKSINMIDACIGFATEVTKELEKENAEAKEIIRELSTYVRDNCYTRTLGESLDRQGLLEKAEAFLKE